MSPDPGHEPHSVTSLRPDPDVKHKDGVPWHKAPVPPGDHHCWVQTSGWTGEEGLTQVLRCACGAIADGISIKSASDVGMSPSRQDRFWMERNSRSTPGSGPVDLGHRRFARYHWWLVLAVAASTVVGAAFADEVWAVPFFAVVCFASAMYGRRSALEART